MNTQTVTLFGNTYPVREKLKANGWKWNADRGAWVRAADSAMIAAAANRETGARRALANAVGGAWRECRIDLHRAGMPSVSLWIDNDYPVWAQRNEARMHDVR